MWCSFYGDLAYFGRVESEVAEVLLSLRDRVFGSVEVKVSLRANEGAERIGPLFSPEGGLRGFDRVFSRMGVMRKCTGCVKSSQFLELSMTIKKRSRN